MLSHNTPILLRKEGLVNSENYCISKTVSVLNLVFKNSVMFLMYFFFSFFIGILHLTVKLPERGSEFLPTTLSQLAMYLWLLVFWLQPHKEERFLFPVYPLICLAAALSVDTIQKLWYAFLVKVHIRYGKSGYKI